MPEHKLEPDSRRQQTIDAVATFTALMHAYERGELSRAADAQAELARLGVVVRVIQPPARSENGGRHD